VSVPGNGGDDAPLFLSHYEGAGENKGIGLYSGENAKVALDAAFAQAMRLMFSDRRFMNALLKTGAPPPSAPPPAAVPPAPDQAPSVSQPRPAQPSS
jgi:hypothetical protein